MCFFSTSCPVIEKRNQVINKDENDVQHVYNSSNNDFQFIYAKLVTNLAKPLANCQIAFIR